MSQKTRTFTGCNTCRARKVKCDLSRPKCQRCVRSRLECGGYDIKLGWSNPLIISSKDGSLVSLKVEGNIELEQADSSATTNDRTKFRRRNLELVNYPALMKYETYRELSWVIGMVDQKVENGISKFTVGPFGVYTIERKRQNFFDRPTVKKPRTEPKSSNIFSKTDNSYVHYELLNSAKLTINAIKGSNYVFNEQNMFHILYPKFFPNVDSDDWDAHKGVLDNFVHCFNTTVVVKPLFAELLKDFNSCAFPCVKINFHNNYWDTLVKPYVRQVVCEFVCEGNTVWHQNAHLLDRQVEHSKDFLEQSLKMGLIYLLLSVLSFNKSSIVRESKQETYNVDYFLKMSINLRKLGMGILDYHLDEYDTNYKKFESFSYDYEILMLLTIIMSITTDHYFGVFENYELMYAIGDFVMKNRLKSERSKIPNIAKYLLNTFKIMCVFHESTQSVDLVNYSISEDDEKIKYGDLNENYDLIGNDSSDDYESDESETAKNDFKPLSDDIINNYNPLLFTINFNRRPDGNYFEEEVAGTIPEVKVPQLVRSTNFQAASSYMMYGLPQSLLELLHEIVHLTNHKRIFRIRKIQPRNFPKICADIEDRLVNWDINKVWTLYENNSGKQVFILKVHEAVYYNVLSMHQAIIVYFNRLIKEIPIAQYQHHIMSSLMNLHKLMQLNDEVISPSFWVILVCGSDIDVQDARYGYLKNVCEKLWSHPQFDKYNYWRSKQILFEIWKRRLLGEDFGFMDMVREWGIVLNLC